MVTACARLEQLVSSPTSISHAAWKGLSVARIFDVSYSLVGAARVRDRYRRYRAEQRWLPGVGTSIRQTQLELNGPRDPHAR